MKKRLLFEIIAIIVLMIVLLPLQIGQVYGDVSGNSKAVTSSTYAALYGNTYEPIKTDSSIYTAIYAPPSTVYDITYGYTPVVFDNLEYCYTCVDHRITKEVTITINSFSYNTVSHSVYYTVANSVYGAVYNNGILSQPKEPIIDSAYLESNEINDPTTGGTSIIITKIDIKKFTYKLVNNVNNQYTYSLSMDMPDISYIERISSTGSRYQIGSKVGIFAAKYTLNLTIK
jgi:hypothetical protein